jgi:hypothetical protein
MTMKLRQKAFLKGNREFEIADDVVNVRIKKLFKEEKLTVGLSTLNPEPVSNGPLLEFYGRGKSEPLLSLLLNKPNAEEFNNFVAVLKQKALGKDNSFAGVEALAPETSRPEAPGWNVYEEPPEFAESDKGREEIRFQPVNPKRVEEDITMLKTYLNEEDIQPLLASLEALKVEPENEVAFQKMMDSYNELGFNQGAVLTYAPYLKVLLSKYGWS